MKKSILIIGMVAYVMVLLVVSSSFLLLSSTAHTPFLGNHSQAKTIDKNITTFMRSGETHHLDSLNQDEQEHIRDVRRLAIGALILGVIMLRVFLLAWNNKPSGWRSRLAGVRLGKKPSTIERLAIMLAPFVFIQWITIMSLSISFSDFFLAFHKILFPQGNFLFPLDSLLIQTYPETFFMSIAAVFISIVALLATLFLVFFIYKNFIKSKDSTRST